MSAPDVAPDRPLLRATILSIGSELTVGDTRDTNAGELARGLVAHGVEIERLTAVPDRLEVVTEAFATALTRSDLVVSTGGLGPTPDDLTREAIAAVCGEIPEIDPELERWLRALWRRRGLPFPEINLKQAWRIRSSQALPNPNGTAPGWYVTRPDGRVVVAMPGPPREMRPMWANEVLPRLAARTLGRSFAARTYRTAGIGESQLAELLGEALLRAENPEVATYARADAVDVRIAAVDGPGPDGAPASAAALVEATAALVEARLADRIWATGDTTWSQAIGAALEHRGWRMAAVERGTGGQLAALLGDASWLVLSEAWADDPGPPTAAGHPGAGAGDPGAADPADAAVVDAEAIRARAGAPVGVALHAHASGDDTLATIAVVTPAGASVERRTAFLGGPQGRTRAALAAAAVVVERVRAAPS